MTHEERESADEAAIRGRIESWTQALRRKDAAALLAHYTPDVVGFELAPPLEHRRDAHAAMLAAWFPTWDGPIGYEVTELAVTAGADVAFAHSLNRLFGKRTSGETSDMWFRSTVGFRKVDGAWMVAHEHGSVPFYMDGTYRAASDLHP